MEETEMSRMERMEKVQQEMGEQLSQMAGLLEKLNNEKMGQLATQEGHQLRNAENSFCPVNMGSRETQSSQEPQANPTEGYVCPNMPSAVDPSQFQGHATLTMNPLEPIRVANLHSHKEQGMPQVEGGSNSRQKIELIEERLRIVEGMDFHGSLDADGLCLVPGVVIPSKFKAPKFEKYDETTCPKAHITMYCRKMAAHVHDDQLLIHVFQNSLKGSAARWYTQLGRGDIHSWEDLARAFVAQYKHIVDSAPDRLSLQTMEKKATEGFREYAQRWKNVATQVQPPFTEKETATLFLSTFQAPYYDRMIGNVTKNFADMVASGEMIESAIKRGKIKIGDMADNRLERTEEEVQAATFEGQFPKNSIPHNPYLSHPTYGPTLNNASYDSYLYSPVPQPGFSTNSYASTVARVPTFTPRPVAQLPQQSINNRKRSRSNQGKILILISDLLPLLVKNQYLAPIPLRTAPNPLAKSYDPNSRCDYHMGAIGHSTEKCKQLKERIEELINGRILTQELMEQWKSTLV